MPLPRVTIAGNLTRDPEVKFLPSGTAVANLRVASSDRKRDDAGNWTNGEPCYLDVEVWRDTGEAAANTLKKGDGVVIVGRLRMRTYTKQDGTEVTAYSVEADEIAPSLRRSSSPAPARSHTADPWASDDVAPF
jgi:single-strand DNA-binding protein